MAQDDGLTAEAARMSHHRGDRLAHLLDRLPTRIRDTTHRLLAPEGAARVIFDLGLVRNIGYYTGAVFQVYDPAYGMPIGSGGRYDELLGTFGRPLPAVGFALNVERLHIALTSEERAARR